MLNLNRLAGLALLLMLQAFAMMNIAAAQSATSTEPLSEARVVVGNGNCRTLRRAVYQANGFIEIEIDRPYSGRCTFSQLALVIDGIALDGPSSVSSGIAAIGDGRYGWNDTRGRVMFAYDKPLSKELVNAKDPVKFGLIGLKCERDCVTETALEKTDVQSLLREGKTQGHFLLSKFADSNGGKSAANRPGNDLGAFSMDKAISLAQSSVSHASGMAYLVNKNDPIRNYAIDYLRFSEGVQKLWLLKGSVYSDIQAKRCSAKIDGISTLMNSSASELWNRHGRQDIDELHSVSDSSIYWIGDCDGGKASGQGVIAWFYIGKINSSTKTGFVRSITYMNSGTPSNEVTAYSNSDTCFNTCIARNYENRLLGTLQDGVLISNKASQDIQKQANSANNAMGEILGIAVNKAAEIIREGSQTSTSTTSGSNAAGNWIVESSRKERGVSWHATIYIKCTSGRRSGESFPILALDNGRFQSVYGPTEASLDKVAGFHCN